MTGPPRRRFSTSVSTKTRSYPARLPGREIRPPFRGNSPLVALSLVRNRRDPHGYVFIGHTPVMDYSRALSAQRVILNITPGDPAKRSDGRNSGRIVGIPRNGREQYYIVPAVIVTFDVGGGRF